MTRRFGRSLKGERLVDKVPHGHWKTTTFIAALRSNGVCAPFLLDSPMDGDCFLVYVEQILCPSLRPGDIVILDNLRLHKAPRIEQLIHAVGAQIKFLPPYSPDLNPIEQLFAKFKQLLRSAAKRTLIELWDHISNIICSAFSARECSNYFTNSGYTVS
jgi:transposase